MESQAPKAKDLLSNQFRGLVDAPAIGQIDYALIEQMRVAIPGLGTTRLVERRDYKLPGDQDLSVRLHRPVSSTTSDLPCVLALHGGGYVVGSHDMDDTRFESWCPDLGIAGISVQYRLAPDPLSRRGRRLLSRVGLGARELERARDRRSTLDESESGELVQAAVWQRP